MKHNALKAKLAAGQVVYGPFMNCSYGAMIEIVGLAGFDYAIVDMEHGPLGAQAGEDLCRAAQAVGISPIVRVRKNDGPQIQRALDIGSAGVQVPQIETRADAELAVRSAKYAPLGMRGLSFYTRAGDYTINGIQGLTDALNREQLVIVHVEGVRGLQHLDEIEQVPHLDVIFLGPYDLSQSLGIPGHVDDARVTSGMERAIDTIRAAGKWAGTFAADAPTARRWVDAGAQYLSVGVDVGIFAAACRELRASLP